MQTIIFTLLALLAFAGNSVLSRYALQDGLIDAGSFTALRILSAAVFVLILVVLRTYLSAKPIVQQGKSGSWQSAFYLFLYVVTFSYAYLSLNTGVGALILFAAVQVTMFMTSIFRGERVFALQWCGLGIAFSGLCYLLWPSAQALALNTQGVVLMLISGIAWGLYSVAAKSRDPLRQTAGNFVRALPMLSVLLVLGIEFSEATVEGVMVAILCGALTTGLGYALWYAALTQLKTAQAALLQLSVPIIASFAGILLLDEALSMKLMISTALVIGGILVAALAKKS